MTRHSSRALGVWRASDHADAEAPERGTSSGFERVVLGIDFGSVSLAAARWATANVAPRADAVLAHVVPFPDAPQVEDDSAPRRDALQQMTPALAGGLGGFGATLDVASARTALRVGRPSRWLARIAEDVQASLVVLGRRHDANRTRIGEPNVIERVARRTSASFLVVPEGTVEPPRHIVAAVDESPFAPRVLDVAQRLARLHGCALTILHVLAPTVGAYDRVIRTARRSRTPRVPAAEPVAQVPLHLPARASRWLVELWRAQRSAASGAVEVAIGDPAREIAARAAELDAPLVVVGQRGADDAPAGTLGSVARELLTRAPMPVLAVHPG